MSTPRKKQTRSFEEFVGLLGKDEDNVDPEEAATLYDAWEQGMDPGFLGCDPEDLE